MSHLLVAQSPLIGAYLPLGRAWGIRHGRYRGSLPNLVAQAAAPGSASSALLPGGSPAGGAGSGSTALPVPALPPAGPARAPTPMMPPRVTPDVPTAITPAPPATPAYRPAAAGGRPGWFAPRTSPDSGGMVATGVTTRAAAAGRSAGLTTVGSGVTLRDRGGLAELTPAQKTGLVAAAGVAAGALLASLFRRRR